MAARRVTGQKRPRGPSAASSRAAAADAAHFDSDGLPSKTSLRRALGGGYTRGHHPVKRAINEWVCRLADRTLAPAPAAQATPANTAASRPRPPPPPPPPPPPHWVLILETGAAQTVDCLLSASSSSSRSNLRLPSASHIVVPNPSVSVCSALQTAHPSILTFPCTSHTFFREICENRSRSAVAASLLAAGWSGTFDIVWLDYCGTFSSKAGRRRQADLRRLFRFGLLASPSLVVATASQRGAVTYYEDEVVDDVLGFLRRVGSGQGTGFGGRDSGEGGTWDRGRGGVVSAAAKAVTHTSLRRVTCAGVAVHSVTSRMYTVAVAVDGRGTLCTIRNDLGEVPAGSAENDDDDECLERRQVTLPGGGTSTVRTYARWRALASLRSGGGLRQTTPLWHAWRRMANRFSRETKLLCGGGVGGGAGRWTALVMDNKLLHVSTAVSGAAERVFAVVPSPVEAGLACEMLRSRSDSADAAAGGIGNVRVIVESVSRATRNESRVLPSESTDPSACRAVWLSYHATKAMGAAELHRCDKWSDVNNLLERGWIHATSQAASCLGVHIKYSNVGLVWEHSHVDWLVSGMQRAARAHGLSFETRYVCDFTFRAPHVMVIFKVTRRNGEEEEEEEEERESRSSRVAAAGVVATAVAATPPLPQRFKEWNGKWAMIGQVGAAAVAADSKGGATVAIPAATGSASRTSTITGRQTRRRPRIPSSSSQKYARNVVPWISDLVHACGLSSLSIVLAEPGFNHVLPALLHGSSRVFCSAGNDHIQYAELLSRRRQDSADDASLRCALEPPPLDQLPAETAKTAVLMSDGGVRSWRGTWFEWTRRWISGMLPRGDAAVAVHAGVLVVLVSASKGTEQMSRLVTDVEAIGASAGVTVRSLPIHHFHWEHVPFGLVAVVFGDACRQPRLGRVEEVWAVAQSLGCEKSAKKKKKKNDSHRKDQTEETQ